MRLEKCALEDSISVVAGRPYLVVVTCGDCSVQSGLSMSLQRALSLGTEQETISYLIREMSWACLNCGAKLTTASTELKLLQPGRVISITLNLKNLKRTEYPVPTPTMPHDTFFIGSILAKDTSGTPPEKPKSEIDYSFGQRITKLGLDE